LSKKCWSEPKPEWLPLRLGPFSFTSCEGICAHANKASLRELASLLASKSGARAVEIYPVGATFSFYFKDGAVDAEVGGVAVADPRWPPHVSC
jgi:hypothetical protein